MAITRGATVTPWVDTATPIETSFSHTVDSGTTLLLVAFGCEGDLSIDAPAWNTTETMTLISSVTTSSAGGDVRVYIYGRVNPTATAANISYTVTGTGDNAWGVAVNYLGTISTSVADATNEINTNDNSNGPSQTVTLSGTTTLGSTLFIAGTFYGGDGDPATESSDGGFSEPTASSATGTSTTTDTSYYVGDKIAGGTGGTVSPTIDWTGTANDECVGVFIELLSTDRFSSPGSGSVQLTGNAPSIGLVTDEITVESEIALTTTTYAPTISVTSTGANASPGTGTLRAVGNTPTTGVTHSAWPAAAALLIVGMQPLVSTTHSSSPGSGTLIIGGQQPTVSTTRSAAPASGVVQMVGGQPTVYVQRSAWPGSGTVTFGGQQPQVSTSANRDVYPSSGSLLAVGQTPTVDTDKRAWPAVGALQLVGNQPQVSAGTSTNLTVDAPLALTTTTYAPSVTIALASLPGTGTVQIIGQTPVVGASRSAAPGTGSALFVGNAPTVSLTHSASPGNGTLVFSGQQPNVESTLNRAVFSGSGSLRVTGQQPTAGATRSSSPGSGTLRLVGNAASLSVTFSSAPSTGALRFVGQAATVETNRLTSPGTGTLNIVGQQPRGGTTVSPSEGEVRLVGNVVQNIVGVPLSLSVNRLSLSTQPYIPAITFSRLVHPGSGTLRISGNEASTTPITTPDYEVVVRERMLAVDKPFLTVVWAEPTLDINGVATTVDGYRVYAGTSPTVLTQYAEVTAPTTWAQIRVAAAGTWYVRVAAYNSFGESDLSLIETVTVSASKYTPTVQHSPAALPGSGSLVLIGQQPTIGTAQIHVHAVSGSLIFAGQQPTVAATRSSSPGSGTLRIAGQGPAKAAVPNGTTLRFVGQQATVRTDRRSLPSTGTVRMAGQAASTAANTDKVSRPGTGSVRTVGLTPLVYAKVWTYPQTGVLRIEGRRGAVGRWSPTEGKWFERLTIYSVLSGVGNWFLRDAWDTRDAELTAHRWSERAFATEVVPRLGEGTPRAAISTLSGAGHRGVVDLGGTIEVYGNAATLSGEGTVTYAELGGNPGSGTLQFVGNAPTTRVSINGEVFAVTGTVRISGNIPTTNARVYPDSGELKIYGNSPYRAITGTGAVSALIPRLSGTGTQTIYPRAYSGTGALVAPRATISAIEKPVITGYGNLVAPSPTVHIHAWVNRKHGPPPWSKKPKGSETWTIVNTPEEDWNG